MAKLKLDWETFNKLYQFNRIAHEQGLEVTATVLSKHFELPTAVGKNYRFLIENVNLFLPNFYREDLNTENRLVIPDIHTPFVKKGFLEHCIKTYYNYNCNKITFLGDILDNHFPSKYATDPDGMGARGETELAIEILQPWHAAFPDAEVCIGNHDDRIRRQAFEAGISKLWLKDFKDVLEVPTWNFQERFEHHNVVYLHGQGGGGITGAYTKVLNWRKSLAQGHWHSSSYTKWSVSEIDRLFAMQLGCGIDYKAYAMAYAINMIRKPIIECGVILDNGRIPIHVPMYLGEY